MRIAHPVTSHSNLKQEPQALMHSAAIIIAYNLFCPIDIVEYTSSQHLLLTWPVVLVGGKR